MINKHTKENVFKSTLEYFNGDELATDVWIRKYCLKDENNLYELNPDQMHRRLAKELARIESKYPNPLSEEEIYETLKNFTRVVLQGSPMSGIGNDFQIVSLSNCFVIGNENKSDSYGGIMKLDQEMVQLQKRRGGVGLDLSFIRPTGSPVKNSAITSTGVVPFMERYSNSTKEVAQDGRRGALMESISIKHPDAEKFIDAKLTEGKVTGANVSIKLHDDFMRTALNDNNNDYLQNYPIDLENVSLDQIDKYDEIITVTNNEDDSVGYIKKIDAKRIWNKIIHNAWKSAEPGILFWDKIIGESIPDCYNEFGFGTTSTNPCIVGETLVAVADGRGSVSIKELAEEGKDVDVYCFDTNGKIAIRRMRNPRITGYDSDVYKITLDDGNTITATSNHKFRLKSGKYVELKDLKNGDSLDVLTKVTKGLHDVFEDSNSKSQDYYWLYNSHNKKHLSEHRLIAEHNLGSIKGKVIHHIDFNGLNNSPDNLQLMKKTEHDKYHGELKTGENNPIFNVINDEIKFESWKKNLSIACKGKLNGNSKNISNEDLLHIGIEFSKSLGRRFSTKEWKLLATKLNLPQVFTNYRKTVLGSIKDFSLKCAEYNNFKNNNIDTRLLETQIKMINMGYNTKIDGNNIMVEKKCETCGNLFWIEHDRREISFCSHECALMHINTSSLISEKRNDGRMNYFNERSSKIKNEQLSTYTKLKFELNRKPYLNEWELECKKNNIPHRLNNKSKTMFKNYKEVVQEGELFNHRITNIEYCGKSDVYNGTVDDFHNFFIGGYEKTNEFNKPNYLFVNSLQCGEIPLCPYDSCRLTVVNLYGYVVNPFTENAYFDWDLFKKDVIKAQRYMDDIIDLEIEKIDKIIEKIDSDPEDEFIKIYEKNLWNKIKEMAIKGRRTGLGITAEGDMLAALGLIYGTDEGNDFSVEVHKTLKLEAYRSSVIMAKERGAFPVYNSELEDNNPFINRIKNEDIDLYTMMQEYGRRNIALLTIAPTGTTSLMTQTTSGIEPVFLPAYMRRRKINPQEKNMRVDFVDPEGQSWMEYPVFHHKFETWLKTKGYNIEEVKNMTKTQLDEIVKISPYYKATSNDVDWVKKVEMQGRIQEHVDHSISVTVNLPKDTTEETVSKVYETGWRSGCKGLTIYRDGCRSGVLISNKSDDKKNVENFSDNHAPKRPKRLKGEIHRFQNNLEKWIAVVGIKDGRPYELFTGRLQNGLSELPISIKECEVVKKVSIDENGKKLKQYNIEYVDVNGNKQVYEGINKTFNPEFWNYGKLISGILRHGMPLVKALELIESLSFSEEHINSWKNGVIRVIKRYIKDGEKSKGECPVCGGEDFEFKEGCLMCTGCSWSKCS
ncbi:MAG: HNH endonuclease [Peptostreptococcales bacterium]